MTKLSLSSNGFSATKARSRSVSMVPSKIPFTRTDLSRTKIFVPLAKECGALLRACSRNLKQNIKTKKSTVKELNRVSAKMLPKYWARRRQRNCFVDLFGWQNKDKESYTPISNGSSRDFWRRP